jgi:hypothetical protein
MLQDSTTSVKESSSSATNARCLQHVRVRHRGGVRYKKRGWPKERLRASVERSCMRIMTATFNELESKVAALGTRIDDLVEELGHYIEWETEGREYTGETHVTAMRRKAEKAEDEKKGNRKSSAEKAHIYRFDEDKPNSHWPDEEPGLVTNMFGMPMHVRFKDGSFVILEAGEAVYTDEWRDYRFD